jgi:hypothetical protein
VVLNLDSKHLVFGLALLLAVTATSTAHAQRESSVDALERMAEALEPAVNGGALDGVAPIILVGARPAFEETRSWFPTAAVVAFADAVGRGKLRACEACMQPRVQAEGGAFVYSSGARSSTPKTSTASSRSKSAPPRSSPSPTMLSGGCGARA